MRSAVPLPRIRERHPRIADLVGVALFRGRFPEGSNLQAAATCRERLVDVGFDAPEWEDVARGQRPGRPPENRDPTEPHFGWQLSSGLSFHRRKIPMWSICWHPVHLFTSGGRVALGTSDLPGSAPSSSLVPPPSLAHFCRCGRPLDVRGHHRSACGRAGVLGRRGFPLESAAARLPRGRGEGLSQRPRG